MLQRCAQAAWRKITHNLSRDIVLAPGEDPLPVDEGVFTLPALLRSVGRPTKWLQYVDEFEAGDRMGQTTFRKLISVLTRKEVVCLRALDYFLADLLLEPFERIKGILADLILTDPREKQALLRDLDLVYKTLQHSHGRHVSVESDCTSHNPRFALGHADCTLADGSCSSCAACIRFFDTRLLPVIPPEFHDIVGHCKDKAVLFMGHTLRAKAQSAAIGALRVAATNVRVHIVIDWMLKFEELRYRESTREHYGKRGMSVHGAALMYFQSDGTVLLLYYHMAVEGDSKQDAAGSLSVVEGIFSNMKKDPKLSAATHVTIQSDNAANYSSYFFTLFLFILARRYSLTVLAYIHNEAQDGKDIVDSSFFTLKRSWRKWVREVKRPVLTTADMVEASSYQKIQNYLFQVLKYDRAKLALLELAFEAVKGRMGQAFPSHIAEIKLMAGGIYYVYESSALDAWKYDKQIKDGSGVGKINTWMQNAAHRLDMTLEFFQQLTLGTLTKDAVAPVFPAVVDLGADTMLTGVEIMETVQPPASAAPRAAATGRRPIRRHGTYVAVQTPRPPRVAGAMRALVDAPEENSDDEDHIETESDSSGSGSSEKDDDGDHSDGEDSPVVSMVGPRCPSCGRGFKNGRRVQLHLSKQERACKRRFSRSGITSQAIRACTGLSKMKKFPSTAMPTRTSPTWRLGERRATRIT
jgi:hypothetical protein